MSWRRSGSGPTGPVGQNGALGDPGHDGERGRDGVVFSNKTVDFSEFMSTDFLEDLLRRAEDDFAAERLTTARSLLEFVRRAAHQAGQS